MKLITKIQACIKIFIINNPLGIKVCSILYFSNLRIIDHILPCDNMRRVSNKSNFAYKYLGV